MDELKSLNLIYEETKTQIERQFHTLTSLDTKSNITAGVTGIILGIVVSRTPPNFISWVWVFAMILLFSSLFCALSGLWIVGWRSDPAPLGMKFYLTEEEITTKRQFLENMIQSYEENRHRINRKVWRIRFAMGFLFFGLMAVLLLILTK